MKKYRFLIIIFVVILLLHVLVISYAFRSSAPAKPEVKPVEITETEPGKKEETAVPPPAPQPPPPRVSTKPARPWNYRTAAGLPAKLRPLESKIRSGIVVDLATRRVLWQKDARKPVPIASLTKLMTVLLVAEKMSVTPSLTLDTPVIIDGCATGVERSHVLGLLAGEKYLLSDLLKGALVGSYNDAAGQLAGVVSGNVPDFVKLMNGRARELGLTSTRFNTPNGLPLGPKNKRVNSFCSLDEVVKICEMLLDYPEVIQFCKLGLAKFSTGKVIAATNYLVYNNKKRGKKVPGMFGFKTGYTDDARCCLAFGVERNGRIIIGAVAGVEHGIDRDNFCRGLIEYAYSVK